MKNSFIFKEVNGELKYVGDFEGFYRNVKDPWEQSGGDLHKFERQKLVNILNEYPIGSILNIGCGLGYETSVLQQLVCNDTTGMDISRVAIKKAKKNFPHIKFIVGDIRKPIKGSYDAVILNGMLWYLLPDLDKVVVNVSRLIEHGGYFVVSQVFIDDQRYGKEIIDGFSGLIKFVCGLEGYTLAYAYYEKFKGYKKGYGTVVLQKVCDLRKEVRS